MGRAALAILVLGGFLSWRGVEEIKVSTGSSAEPQKITLEELEEGKRPVNNHLVIGEHVRLFPLGVAWMELGMFGAEPSPDAQIFHCYYPIVSADHPILEYDIDQNPDTSFSGTENFVVLVKTDKFKKAREYPQGTADSMKIQGLVVNKINEFEEDERKLLKQSFPTVDLNQILVLEEDRKPTSAAKGLGMITGGLLIIMGAAAFGVFAIKKAKEKEAAPIP